eukprot:scaffold95655_cov116-Phaeocystis_antarctica.AAC.1
MLRCCTSPPRSQRSAPPSLAARATRAAVLGPQIRTSTCATVWPRSEVAGVVVCGDRGARAEWRLCRAVGWILLACGLARW